MKKYLFLALLLIPTIAFAWQSNAGWSNNPVIIDGDIYTSSMKATSGTNFICVDTNGKFVKSTSACSGT